MCYVCRSFIAAVLPTNVSEENASCALIALLGDLKHLTGLFSVHLKQSWHFHYWRFGSFSLYGGFLVCFGLFWCCCWVWFYWLVCFLVWFWLVGFCLFRFRTKGFKPKCLFLIYSKILATSAIMQIKIGIFLENFNGMQFNSDFYFL